MLSRAIGLSLVLPLSGCFLWRTPELPKPTVTVAPAVVAGNPDSATRADIYADKSDASESKAAAAVLAASRANKDNPGGTPKEAVSLELGVASSFLSKPTEADRLEAENRVSKVLAGERLEEAYRKAANEADRLQRERDAAWESYEREKGVASAALAAVKVAEAERRNYLLALFGAGLFALGVVLAALGSLIPGGRKVGAIVAAGGAAAVLVTLVVSADWFIWVVAPPLGLLGLAVAFAGWRFVLSKFSSSPKCKSEKRKPSR
jgi:hypothetical protein